MTGEAGQPGESPVPPGTGWPEDPATSATPIADSPAAVRRLASVLGAHVLVEEGDVMIDVITRVARERGTTYILMGSPPARSGWQRLTRPSLLFQILRALPGVDLRIVADRTQRPEEDA